MIYLATPHAHEDPSVEAAREKAAHALLEFFMTLGCPVFSPIVHSAHNRPSHFEHQDYLDYDKHFLDMSRKLMIGCLPGWESSKGIAWEIEYMKSQGKQTFQLNSSICKGIVPAAVWNRLDPAISRLPQQKPGAIQKVVPCPRCKGVGVHTTECPYYRLSGATVALDVPETSRLNVPDAPEAPTSHGVQDIGDI